MLQGKYPLLVALVLGLFAGVVAYSAIKSRERAVREGWDTKRVLCATVDIVEGTELDEDMIAVCEMPERFVTDSFIIVPEGDREGLIMPYGQRVLVPLRPRDPILYSHFESQRDFTLSEMIPAKGRAMALEVTEKNSVAQWIRPNDHVDVVGTFRDPETREMVTVTLLQNIIVLATGRITGMNTYIPEEDKRYNHVIVLVLPEEAEILTLAQETGTLTLTLRNPEDLEKKEDDRKYKVDGKSLLTGERTAALDAKRVKTFQPQGVEIIRGSQSQRQGSIPKLD